MSDNFGTAGYFSLEEFVIIDLANPSKIRDIKNHVYRFNIKESMESGYMTGSVEIHDAVDILSGFPLKGEELLIIRWKDFYLNEHTDVFCVYSITDVTDSKNYNDTLMTYKLHYTSANKYFTDFYSIQRGFRNSTIAEIVDIMFTSYYNNPEFYSGIDRREILNETNLPDFNPFKPISTITPTKGIQSLVIPSLSPDQTMEFLTRRAVTDSFEDQTQMFRFFETKFSYLFTTHDELNYGFVDAIPNVPSELRYFYSPTLNYAESTQNLDQLRIMQKILDFEYPQDVHTIRDSNSGSYIRRAGQIDILNRSYLPEDYNHLSFTNEYQYPDGYREARPVHGPNFIDKYFKNRAEILMIKDYPGVGESGGDYLRPPTYYAESYNKKIANFYHHNLHKTKMRVYGRIDLIPGTVIQVDLPEIKYEGTGERVHRREDDEVRGKNFLVETVDNVFYEDRYYALLEVSKSGLGREI